MREILASSYKLFFYTALEIFNFFIQGIGILGQLKTFSRFILPTQKAKLSYFIVSAAMLQCQSAYKDFQSFRDISSRQTSHRRSGALPLINSEIYAKVGYISQGVFEGQLWALLRYDKLNMPPLFAGKCKTTNLRPTVLKGILMFTAINKTVDKYSFCQTNCEILKETAETLQSF